MGGRIVDLKSSPQVPQSAGEVRLEQQADSHALVPEQLGDAGAVVSPLGQALDILSDVPRRADFRTIEVE